VSFDDTTQAAQFGRRRTSLVLRVRQGAVEASVGTCLATTEKIIYGNVQLMALQTDALA
jgi:hypothetical protein